MNPGRYWARYNENHEFQELVPVAKGTDWSTWGRPATGSTPADERPWQRPTYAAPFGTTQHPHYDHVGQADADAYTVWLAVLIVLAIACGAAAIIFLA